MCIASYSLAFFNSWHWPPDLMTQIQKLGFWICIVLLILIWSSVIMWAQLIGQTLSVAALLNTCIHWHPEVPSIASYHLISFYILKFSCASCHIMMQIQKLGFWICTVLLILIWSSIIAWARLISQYNFLWYYDLNCIIAWASLIGYSFDWPITVQCYPPSHAVPIPNRFL